MWDEGQHPRVPAGEKDGGEFTFVSGWAVKDADRLGMKVTTNDEVRGRFWMMPDGRAIVVGGREHVDVLPNFKRAFDNNMVRSGGGETSRYFEMKISDKTVSMVEDKWFKEHYNKITIEEFSTKYDGLESTFYWGDFEEADFKLNVLIDNARKRKNISAAEILIMLSESTIPLVGDLRRVVALAEALSLVSLGEAAGHEFRGNQWTGGIDGGVPEGINPGASTAGALNDMERAGNWKLEKTKQTGNISEYAIVPKSMPDGIVEQKDRWGGPEYIDPEVGTFNPDPDLTYPDNVTFKDGWSLKPPVESEQGKLFRGMSAGEFESIRDTGRIQSTGDFNIGKEQEGLTYFSTEVDQAESYSSGFAPWQYAPSFGRPAYIVEVKDPGNSVHVVGTGETERGVPGIISKEMISTIYEGRPYSVRPGMFEFVRGYDGKHSEGSRSSPRVMIAWRKMKPTKLFWMAEWDESLHPRVEAGSPDGGQFTSSTQGHEISEIDGRYRITNTPVKGVVKVNATRLRGSLAKYKDDIKEAVTYAGERLFTKPINVEIVSESVNSDRMGMSVASQGGGVTIYLNSKASKGYEESAPDVAVHELVHAYQRASGLFDRPDESIEWSKRPEERHANEIGSMLHSQWKLDTGRASDFQKRTANTPMYWKNIVERLRSGAYHKTTKLADWDESQHPRVDAGSPDGGEFTSGTGTATKSATRKKKVVKIKPVGPKSFGRGAEQYVDAGKQAPTDARRIEQGVPQEIIERRRLEIRDDPSSIRPPLPIPQPEGVKSLRAHETGNGECYNAADKFVLQNKDWTTVHATLYPRSGAFADKVFLHGFAEKGNVVYDGVFDSFYDRDKYYKYYDITDERRYDSTQLRVMLVRYGHYGPWE